MSGTKLAGDVISRGFAANDPKVPNSIRRKIIKMAKRKMSALVTKELTGSTEEHSKEAPTPVRRRPALLPSEEQVLAFPMDDGWRKGTKKEAGKDLP